MGVKMIKRSYGALLLIVVFCMLLLLHQMYTDDFMSPLSRSATHKSREYVRWLKKSEQEIRNLITHQYNSTYKNPCWYNNGSLTCLPYFYLAGMPKCGTTDLWSKITQHPHITACGWNPAMRATTLCRKEPHFWGKHRFKYGETIHSYLKHWKKFAQQLEDKALPASKQIVGDGSASTFWQLTYRNNVSYRNDPLEYTTAQLIRFIQPQAKFIVIFRNPSERLYSQYNYQKDRSIKSADNFHDCIVHSIDKAHVHMKNFTLRESAYLRRNDESPLWIPRIFLGFYDVFVTDWLRSFPRNQFLFLRLEDWKKDCVNILPEVFEFLSVGPISKEDIAIVCRNEAENVNKLTKETMLPRTKLLLDEFYRASLQRLAFELDDNRFLWND
ncbi:carbohydrate sulfotransferase 15-like [Antedon mediterranea]|uniref:carbohydrate sulfotransferase 15-like n=1 Tax=Antedon mediterranea TaxID=105859 RepID=UPI003AF71C3A